MIQVILLKRIGKLGHIGDVVAVKPGYARNYLLPRGFALRSTPQNLEAFEQRKNDLLAENLGHKTEAEKLASTMKDLIVVAVRQAGESGHLYGSVNTRDVADLVKAKGFNIDRQAIRIDTPIKTIGIHPVHIGLHAEVEFNILVNVAKSEDEAEVQTAKFLEEKNPSKKKAAAKAEEEVVVAAAAEEVAAAEQPQA